jgi:hypothetical protein
LRIYINGALVAETIPTHPLQPVPASSFQIGAEGADFPLDAVIDEVRLSGGVRTPEEIAAAFIDGLSISGLVADPDTIRALPTWVVRAGLAASTQVGTVSIPANAATWSSADSTIATVDSTGAIRVLGPGTVTLTATIQGASADLALIVEAPVLAPMLGNVPAFLATPAASAVHEVPVLILRYLPTRDGVNLDTSVDPDFYTLNPITLAALESIIDSYDLRVKFGLEEGSRFRAYRNSHARPSLGYRVVDCITVYERTPPGKDLGALGGYPVYLPDYHSIFERFDVRHYVDVLGVREIWFWMGGLSAGYPSFVPGYHDPADFRGSWESNMSSPTSGDVSNSDRDPTDLPVYAHTYVLYGYNFRRSQAEALHNHGHQREAQWSQVAFRQDGNTDLFWKKFVGQDEKGQFVTGRCGWTHMPPNTVSHYDYLNSTLVSSDIEDWTPDHSGGQRLVNVDTWGNLVFDWPDGVGEFPQRIETQWYLYWWQSVPGWANGIGNGDDYLSNWWDFIGDWDASWLAGKGLHGARETISATVPGAPTFALRATPNPSKGRVEIAWSLPRAGQVDLAVFDVAGREILRLASGHASAGNHTSTWSGVAPPGLYFVRLRNDGREATQRVLLRR